MRQPHFLAIKKLFILALAVCVLTATVARAEGVGGEDDALSKNSVSSEEMNYRDRFIQQYESKYNVTRVAARSIEAKVSRKLN